MKMVNEAVDEVRKEEQKSAPELKNTKYLWLNNETNLKEEQKENLARLKDSNLQTGRAYQLKLAMQDIWTTPPCSGEYLFNGVGRLGQTFAVRADGQSGEDSQEKKAYYVGFTVG